MKMENIREAKSSKQNPATMIRRKNFKTQVEFWTVIEEIIKRFPAFIKKRPESNQF